MSGEAAFSSIYFKKSWKWDFVKKEDAFLGGFFLKVISVYIRLMMDI